MRLIVFASAFTFLAIGAAAPAAAQAPARIPAPAPAPADAKAVVAEVRRRIAENYVLPERRPALDKVLAEGLASGRYDGRDPAVLAARINEDLARVGQDGHLNFKFDPGRPPRPAPGPMTDGAMKAMAAQARATNHGIRALRLLPGNIRYMDLALFESGGGDEGQAAHEAAMRFLSAGDAVIIDLRHTPGGSASAVQYFASHFIEPGRHLITFKQAGRPDHRVESLPNLPNRMLGKPLYVLTSVGSASASEEFVGHIAGFKVGEIVGETTAGAAFNNHLFDILGGFVLSVSFGRPVLATTGGDWERVGIAPTIRAPVLHALEAAQTHALRRLAAAAPAERKAQLEAMAEALAASAEDRKPEHPLSAYAGRYSGASIDLDDGRLYYRQEGRAPLEMMALGGNRFSLQDAPATRLEFAAEGGAVSGFNLSRGGGPILNRYMRAN